MIERYATYDSLYQEKLLEEYLVSGSGFSYEVLFEHLVRNLSRDILRDSFEDFLTDHDEWANFEDWVIDKFY